MTKHSGRSYAGKAAKYADFVDTSPWNAHYERPAVTSLLPPLEQSCVLDVGCGSGWYADYLLSRGAQVTAFDLDPDFVVLTRKRVGERANVLEHDLSQPLSFAANLQFDVVVCPLVMHYLEDWQPAFREFHRILKPSGTLVFSTHHPFNDWKLFNRENYFDTELLEDEWDNFGKVHFYRRPLTKICDDLATTGFVVERILEPRPSEAFREINPSGYERLCKTPWFLAVRAAPKA